MHYADRPLQIDIVMSETKAEYETSSSELIAAAGTAASELPDDIDPVAAIKALPFLISAAREVQRSQEPIHPRSWGRLGNALAKAKGKSGMTL